MNSSDPVALIPAAGLGTRIAPLACSKEVCPIGSQAASEYILESLSLAGVRTAYVILRHGKWDIPQRLGDGGQLGLRLVYLVVRESESVPFTLDQAWPFSRGSIVLFGFPDIIFEPADAFRSLLKRRNETDADVVLGAFPTERTSTADMVDISPRGRVTRIEVKPEETSLSRAWAIAVWTPEFTQYLHDFMATESSSALKSGRSNRELYLGDVLQAALDGDMSVEAVEFAAGSFIDIGSPEGLKRAVERYSATSDRIEGAPEGGLE